MREQRVPTGSGRRATAAIEHRHAPGHVSLEQANGPRDGEHAGDGDRLMRQQLGRSAGCRQARSRARRLHAGRMPTMRPAHSDQRLHGHAAACGPRLLAPVPASATSTRVSITSATRMVSSFNGRHGRSPGSLDHRVAPFVVGHRDHRARRLAQAHVPPRCPAAGASPGRSHVCPSRSDRRGDAPRTPRWPRGSDAHLDHSRQSFRRQRRIRLQRRQAALGLRAPRLANGLEVDADRFDGPRLLQWVRAGMEGVQVAAERRRQFAGGVPRSFEVSLKSTATTIVSIERSSHPPGTVSDFLVLHDRCPTRLSRIAAIPRGAARAWRPCRADGLDRWGGSPTDA